MGRKRIKSKPSTGANLTDAEADAQLEAHMKRREVTELVHWLRTIWHPHRNTQSCHMVIRNATTSGDDDDHESERAIAHLEIYRNIQG